jgi:hypothetical protein
LKNDRAITRLSPRRSTAETLATEPFGVPGLGVALDPPDGGVVTPPEGVGAAGVDGVGVPGPGPAPNDPDADWTRFVGAAAAVLNPSLFAAVTATRSVWPVSLGAAV